MGSATVPVAVFGVAPKTLQQTNLSNDDSGATPEPARGTPALPPIVHPKMKTGKEPFQCGMRNAECGMRRAPVFAPVFTSLRRGELLRRGKECGIWKWGARPSRLPFSASRRKPVNKLI
jgi:hypothetical protein